MNKSTNKNQKLPQHLLKEWHPIKNGKLDPMDYTTGSHEKVWWYLPYDDPRTGKHFDFEWEAVIKDRVKGNGCPYLSGHKVLAGFNDLESNYPDLAKEWSVPLNDGRKPSQVVCHSEEKVWWVLLYDDPKTGKRFEFVWDATISSRVAGNGCPYLSNTKVWPGYNDLSTTDPELAAQWHPTKNGALLPSEVVAGATRKVWWLFPYDDPKTGKHFDFEWKESIFQRNKNKLCPFLEKYNGSVWTGYNDLKTNYPDLCAEWHYEKNIGVRPEDVSCSSGKIVWWVLPYDDSKTGKHFNFEWQAKIADRTRGYGCPFLSGKRVWKGFNDLESAYPKLAMEWHPINNKGLKPDEVAVNSNKSVWWYFPYNDPTTGKHFNFEWKAKVVDRVKGIGCPYISNALVWKGFNDLATSNKMLASQWHPTKNGNLLPDEVTTGSKKDIWWLCPECGNVWKAKVYSRSKGNGCPNCTLEMKTSFPEAALFYYIKRIYPDTLWRHIINDTELDIFVPSLRTAIEYDGKHWHEKKRDKDIEKNRLCERNNIKLIRVREMLPALGYYSQDIIIKDRSKKSLNDVIAEVITFLGAKNINIDVNRDELDILKIYVNGKKEGSLLNCYPELSKEWHPIKNGSITPGMVYAGSHKRVWWYLSYEDPKTGKQFDFEWQESIKNRVRGRGCPYLSGKKVFRGFNDLETTNPSLASEWHPTRNKDVTPKDVTANSNKLIWWFLPYDDTRTGKHFDFEWQARINLRNRGNGCPFLMPGDKVWEGFNDLQSCRPELAQEWINERNNGLMPNEVREHSNKKVWWKCTVCGNEYQATINSRANGSGCKNCYQIKRQAYNTN